MSGISEIQENLSKLDNGSGFSCNSLPATRSRYAYRQMSCRKRHLTANLTKYTRGYYQMMFFLECQVQIRKELLSIDVALIEEIKLT